MKKMNVVIQISAIVSFSLIASQGLAAGKKNVKSILTGNILGKSVVVPVGSQKQILTFPTPGKVQFLADHTCGDHDVQVFSNNHPSYEFHPKNETKAKLVLGYWINKKTDVHVFPADRFFAVGYSNDFTIKGSALTQFTRPNSTDVIEGYDLIGEAVHTAQALGNSISNTGGFVSGASGQYDMTFAVMACHTLKNTNGTNDGSLSKMNNNTLAIQLTTGKKLIGSSENYFEEIATQILGTGSTLANVNYDILKGDNVTDKSIDIKFQSTGVNTILPAHRNFGDSIAAIAKPGKETINYTLDNGTPCSCEKYNYTNIMQALPIHGQLNSLNAQLVSNGCSINSSAPVTAIFDDSSRKRWEIYPTNNACQIYKKAIAHADMSGQLSQLFDDTSLNKDRCANRSSAVAQCPDLNIPDTEIISDAAFTVRVGKVTKAFIQTVIAPSVVKKVSEIIQASNESKFALNQVSCLPVTAGLGTFNMHMTAGIGLHLTPGAGNALVVSSNPAEPIHPEGFWAINNNHVIYTDTTNAAHRGNKLAIFNNTNGVPTTPALLTPFTQQAPYILQSPQGINNKLWLRSIGCTDGPVKCDLFDSKFFNVL